MSLRIIKVSGPKKEDDHKAQDLLYFTFRICEPTITENKKLQVQIQHK